MASYDARMPTIIHADLDAFYASVEQLDNPELRGRPVVVGGSPEGRGVVAAASYEARAFGVRSAMPMSRAVRLCPTAVRVPPRFSRYAEMSASVFAIFRALTPLVEPLSLDEAFLDVTGWVDEGATPRDLASTLKREVREATGLTLSCGVATNKTVAKIASDLQKPDGLVVVEPGAERTFLAPLPVRALWGVGPKAGQALAQAGITTIEHLAACNDGQAARLLGSHGVAVRDMARGIDPRPVITERERRSVGAETTFAHDLPDGPELQAVLSDTAETVARRLRSAGATASTVALKIRYSNFKTVTRQTTLGASTNDAKVLRDEAARLLQALNIGDRQVRLLGIQCSKLLDGEGRQGVLWTDVSR